MSTKSIVITFVMNRGSVMYSDIFQKNDSAGSLLAPEKRYSPNSVILIARAPKAYPDEDYRKQISQGEKT